MTDERKKALWGMAADRAVNDCLMCKYMDECAAKHWAITTDTNGVDCDNYLRQLSDE
jgi:hypothetical protein